MSRSSTQPVVAEITRNHEWNVGDDTALTPMLFDADVLGGCEDWADDGQEDTLVDPNPFGFQA